MKKIVLISVLIILASGVFAQRTDTKQGSVSYTGYIEGQDSIQTPISKMDIIKANDAWAVLVYDTLVVGDKSPATRQRFNVDGAIQIGETATETDGTIQFDGYYFLGYNGHDWDTLNGGGAGGGGDAYLADTADVFATKYDLDTISSIRQVVDVAEYGADPDSSASVNTTAFQNALIGGNKIVTISKAGVYKLNSDLYIYDSTQIKSGLGITLKMDDDYTYVFANAGILTRTKNYNIRLDNIVIDVNGHEDLPKITDSDYGMRGHLSFFHVDGLEIYNVKIDTLTSSQWGIHLCTWENVIIDGFEITGEKDGIHCGRGDNMIIRNGYLKVDDDGIALNGQDYPNCNPEIGDIKNVLIENVTDSSTATSGYFSRQLLGAFVDWYSGIQVHRGDVIINDAKVYQVDGATGTYWNSATAPTHTSGAVVQSEGFTYVYRQDDTVYSANIDNVVYNNNKLYSNRTFIGVTSYNGSDANNRSIHRDVDFIDYPYTNFTMNGNYSTSTGINGIVQIVDSVYYNITIDRLLNTAGRVFYGFTTNEARISILNSNLKGLTASGVASIGGGEIVLENNIYEGDSLHVYLGAGTETRVNSSTNNIYCDTSRMTNELGDILMYNHQLLINGSINLPFTDSDVGQLKINGHRYLHSYPSTSNVWVGYNAGNFTSTGNYNNGVGNSVGASLTDGENNTFNGGAAGYSTTSGDDNSLYGYQAGYYNSTGIRNTFMGSKAGRSNSTQQYNTGVGFEACGTPGGNFNTTLGYRAGLTMTNSNLLLGASTDAPSKSYCIVLGYNISAAKNYQFLVGYSSAPFISGDMNTDTLSIFADTKIYGMFTCDSIYTTKAAAWADYVFDSKFELPELFEQQKFIKKNKHLPSLQPDDPKQLKVSDGDIQRRLEGAIKELEKAYLYIIDLEKRISKLEKNK